MMLLTLIIYEPHWIDGPIVSEVRSVTHEVEYRHVFDGRRSSALRRAEYLNIIHDTGEVEKYKLWNETQFYVIPFEPVEAQHA
jgi:hypothetical protein